jgi:hypothetical protein
MDAGEIELRAVDAQHKFSLSVSSLELGVRVETVRLHSLEVCAKCWRGFTEDSVGRGRER